MLVWMLLYGLGFYSKDFLYMWKSLEFMAFCMALALNGSEDIKSN